jgi:hypothetical protein
MDDLRRQHQQVADLDNQEHTRLVDLRAQRSRQLLEAEQAEFARRELDKALESIGGDPYKALLYAHTHGQIDAKDLASEMRADRDRQLELAHQLREQERAADRQALEWAREDRLRVAAEAREDRLRLESQSREDRLRLAGESREDQLRREAAARDDERRRLELNLDLLRELAKRGQLDMVNVNVERIIAEVSGTAEAIAGNDRALTDGSDASRDGPTRGEDVDEDAAQSTVDGGFAGPVSTVREEDDD